MKWLSTLYKVSFWLPLSLFVSCFSSSALADTCGSGYPATTPQMSYYTSIDSNKVPTEELACVPVSAFYSTSTSPSSHKCVGSGVSIDIFSSATCSAGYTFNGSLCVNSCTPTEPCPTAGTSKSSPIALSGISGQQGIGASMCATSSGSDCGVTCNSGIASYNDVSGQSSIYCESYSFTGSACSNTANLATSVTSVPSTNQATPVNSPPKSKQDCPGGSGFAEVNNVGMCLPSGTTVTGPASTQTSTAGSVTSTSTTTVNPNGTNTTTTTTTYKDAQGNVTYSGTGTATDGINQAGVPGQGDKPNLGDAPTFDPTLPQEATFNIKAQGNPVFSTEIFQSSASCPPDITYSVMGRDLSISFSSLCAFADVIRGIILMLSALVSMRVVVTQ